MTARELINELLKIGELDCQIFVKFPGIDSSNCHCLQIKSIVTNNSNACNPHIILYHPEGTMTYKDGIKIHFASTCVEREKINEETDS